MTKTESAARGRETPIYMDYAATCPVDERVVQAMLPYFTTHFGNAASRTHRFGWVAEEAVETARKQIAHPIHATAKEIVFTSGATEANNLAIKGAAEFLRQQGNHIITCVTEHKAVIDTCKHLERQGFEVTWLGVDNQGLIDLDELERSFRAQTLLVSIMTANNETGVIQPVAEIARLAHAHGAIVHCDAVQAAGKMAIDVPALGADTLALSAHKLGGPQGVGALFVSDRVVLQAQLVGGGQERGRRAGTENVAGIAGFGAAAHSAADLSQMGAIARLRDATEARLRNIAPRAVVFGAKAARLPNTICVAMPGVAAETQVMALDLAGIAVSAGAACSSGKVKASHVLAAMGVAPELAGSAMRVSAGWRSTAEDFDRFVDAWTALWARLGAPRVGSVAPAA
jgi:cysteine desulfurase